ncbi:MAG TPA: aldehyde dehydrogenase family protein [Candidatus Sulfomarinibacteraceae bacterium]|nr:aldehyde dehydrogenase family protein [Candidatus Sulfomarinibacteraceae bacterium]
MPRLPVPPATERDELDAAVADLRASAGRWIAVPPMERAAMLDELLAAGAAAAGEWMELAARFEGLAPDDPVASEEAIAGPYLYLRGLRLHRDALRQIARYGLPRIPGPVRTRPDGRVTAGVMPVDLIDRLTWLGVTAEVWMEPGLAAADLPSTMALAYRAPDAGGVCLVLGAGNVSSIGPLDVIHKLFVENRVAVLKTHPVTAHLAAVYDAALAPLVRRGFVRIVHGNAVQGGYLCHHPGVDELHITGADRTYEAIVYGAGDDGHARKQRDEPILHKPFSAELGNVTPIIVVPGRWSRAELDYQADNVATMLTNNAGFNCTTARAIVTHAGWPGRGPLLDGIRRRLAATAPRDAFYPGAAARFAGFLADHPAAETIGAPGEGQLPWLLIPGLDPAARDEPCFRVEAFCSVVGETAIEAPDAAAFLDRATAFANETLWGSLNATVIVDPRTAREPRVAGALDRAIAGLRYGTVSLNHWSAIGYGLGITPWGAFPGHTRRDIQSGTGFVHNPLMFSRVEKSVVRAPFRAWPKPVWFGTHRTALPLARRLVPFEADRSLRRLPAILALAVRG